MSNVYLAAESMGAIVILILLYANIFGRKQRTHKSKTFSLLLILNELVVVADTVTWLNVDWKRMPWLLWLLVTVVYILPLFLQAVFSRYLYDLLSEKAKTNKSSFTIMYFYSMTVGIIAYAMCISGKMFTIRDGVYYAGPVTPVYYFFYLIYFIFYFGVVIVNRNKLGYQGLVAVLSFGFVPFISIVIAFFYPEINLAVPFMAIDMLLIYVLLQSERESDLLYKSNIDELTGLYNRRAYEDDRMQYPKIPAEADFVYASIDINGLKQVNDTFGHSAGDEMISGAAYCLKRTLGNYGRVYRIGGDEFAAMFFADEKHLTQVIEDLKDMTDKWRGEQIDYLTVSIGYAEKREFTTETTEEIAEIADKRMYEDKERYYSRQGVDRRGQNEAHKVLCALYTKILKINITDDSFIIVNTDVKEQTREKGYSDRISEWFEGFGRSGGVHPDDLEEYLAKTNLDYMKGFFRRKKKALSIIYRRHYEDGFKTVMMEIIPANDYKDDNQSLFLYVKNIEM